MATPTASPVTPLRRAAASPAEAVLQWLQTAPRGLSSAEARARLARYGPNAIRVEGRSLRAIVQRQVRSGLHVLLLLAALLAVLVGQVVDGVIILALLALNVGLTVLQEYRAERALQLLRALLQVRARVWRDGVELVLPATEVVPGDVVTVRRGDVVPADLRLLEAEHLEVDQATLTGEAVPQPKQTAPVADDRPTRWTNVLFAGTTVVGGRGRGVAVATGPRTLFGQTAALVPVIRAPSEFDVNLQRFGGFLLRFGLLLATTVFGANALLGRDPLDALLLALALVVGTVPEALPAVTATTLALGSARLAGRKVLVRRLSAVEDLGGVDTLCVDKTGTITESRTAVVDLWTMAAPEVVLRAAVLSSAPGEEPDAVEAALAEAAAARGLSVASLQRTPRAVLLPFTPERKRQCVAVPGPGGQTVVCKGAARVIVERCARLRAGDTVVDLQPHRTAVDETVARFQRAGARVIAVAERHLPPGAISPEEADVALTLLGVVALADPPRRGVRDALARCAALGVSVKIVTGDARERAVALAAQIGFAVQPGTVLLAAALRGPEAPAVAERARIVAEAVPLDKERLVASLQRQGHQVAVTGDGVNDVPALERAHVGIAMASGAEAAKAAADLVLLENDLQVIADGIAEGRRLFTNLNRFLLYTLVSNVANVLIVAIASLVVDFLPLRPEHVLTLNLLADLPMLAVVTDRVPPDEVATPRRWDVRHLVELALYLGTINALFAFGLLRALQGQPVPAVYTAWFLLLGVTALLVLFVVRTPRWAWQAPPPGAAVLLAVGAGLLVVVVLVNLPETRHLFQFAPLPWSAQAGIVFYSLGYLLVADLVKRAYRRAVALHAPQA